MVTNVVRLASCNRDTPAPCLLLAVDTTTPQLLLLTVAGPPPLPKTSRYTTPGSYTDSMTGTLALLALLKPHVGSTPLIAAGGIMTGAIARWDLVLPARL